MSACTRAVEEDAEAVAAACSREVNTRGRNERRVRARESRRREAPVLEASTLEPRVRGRGVGRAQTREVHVFFFF